LDYLHRFPSTIGPLSSQDYTAASPELRLND
jgi:hypothetical protein